MGKPMARQTARIVSFKGEVTKSLLSLRDEMMAYVLFASKWGVSAKAQAKKLRKMAVGMAKSLLPTAKDEDPLRNEMAKVAEGKGRYGLCLPLLAFMVSLSTYISKELGKGNVGSKEARNARSEKAYSFLDKASAKARTVGVTEPANSFETSAKEVVTADTLSVNRHRKVPIVFYLCSWHGDCAKDHESLQGRIYIDDRWKGYIREKGQRKEVNIYIAKWHIRTLQKAMRRPTWLITRPNCRHYVEGIPTSEVLSGKPWEEMLEERGMRHKTGPRGGNQTLFHPASKGWYTRENIEAIIRQYEERLALHVRMFEADPDNKSIERDIAKDKILIKKWKGFLSRSHL